MKLEIATKEMRHNRSQEVIESIHFELNKINSESELFKKIENEKTKKRNEWQN